MKDVQKVVAKLMSSLQTQGEKGMVEVLANSAPGNPLASMEYQKVRFARGLCARDLHAPAPHIRIIKRRLTGWALAHAGVRLHARHQARGTAGPL